MNTSPASGVISSPGIPDDIDVEAAVSGEEFADILTVLVIGVLDDDSEMDTPWDAL